jgi:hypothetical protein
MDVSGSGADQAPTNLPQKRLNASMGERDADRNPEVIARLARAVQVGSAASLLLAAPAGADPAPQATPAQPPVTRPTRPDMAAWFRPAAASPGTPDADGFVRRWLLLEPISKPNPTNTVFVGTYVRQALNPGTFPGRFGTVPRDGQQARDGGGPPLRWHALEAAQFDVKLFNFAQAMGKPTYGVIFWAVTVVNSPREMRDVRMAVGSNSASRWWLNGDEAAGLFNDRRMVADDVVSDRLTLRRGRNVIVGAVINGPGLSDFCLRFLDAQGQPVTDLAVDVK